MKAYLSQVPKGRGENLVHQDKESLVKMGYQAYQVFRAPQVLKEPRVKLALQQLVFQDHRVKRDHEDCQDL